MDMDTVAVVVVDGIEVDVFRTEDGGLGITVSRQGSDACRDIFVKKENNGGVSVSVV